MLTTRNLLRLINITSFFFISLLFSENVTKILIENEEKVECICFITLYKHTSVFFSLQEFHRNFFLIERVYKSFF
jgi:hypothetical protein